jgi:hypothetical protein
MAMNKWVKRKWVRALRSGEYAKGKWRLWSREYGGYCCLGVLLCEMTPEFVRVEDGEAWIGEGKEFDPDNKYDPVNNQWIPDDLATLWGLDGDTQRLLASLNDEERDFGPVIAYIERHL